MDLLPEHVTTALANLVDAHRDEFATMITTEASPGCEADLVIVKPGDLGGVSRFLDFEDELSVGLIFNGATSRAIARISTTVEAV